MDSSSNEILHERRSFLLYNRRPNSFDLQIDKSNYSELDVQSFQIYYLFSKLYLIIISKFLADPCFSDGCYWSTEKVSVAQGNLTGELIIYCVASKVYHAAWSYL